MDYIYNLLEYIGNPYFGFIFALYGVIPGTTLREKRGCWWACKLNLCSECLSTALQIRFYVRLACEWGGSIYTFAARTTEHLFLQISMIGHVL